MPPLKAPLDMIKSKIWGFMGVYTPNPLNFWGRGYNSENVWDTLGMGKPQTLRFFGGKSPIIPKFRSGDGGKILGDFYHTSFKLNIFLCAFYATVCQPNMQFFNCGRGLWWRGYGKYYRNWVTSSQDCMPQKCC